MTRPQTVGYGLSDSPVGLAAWMYDKFAQWTWCAIFIIFVPLRLS